EMSPAALKALGIEGNAQYIANVKGKQPTVSLQYLGKGDTSKLPTAESIQKDGAALEQKLAQKKAEEAEKAKQKAKGKGKQASAQQQGGGFFLADVFGHGVVAGEDQLLVAAADPSGVHSGGQAVCTGSPRIFIGPQQASLSGEGDLTEDVYFIKKGTG